MKDTLLLTSLSRAILSISQYPISPNPLFLPRETPFYFTGAIIPLFQHSNCERSELSSALVLSGSRSTYNQAPHNFHNLPRMALNALTACLLLKICPAVIFLTLFI